MAVVELDSGVVVLPKRISLVVAIAVAAQLVGSVYWYATDRAAANSRLEAATLRIERLERDTSRDTALIADINGRTIRMETQIDYVRAAVDRMQRH